MSGYQPVSFACRECQMLDGGWLVKFVYKGWLVSAC